MKRRHVVCASLVIVILLVAAPIAHGDDQPPGVSLSTEHLETENASEPGYDHHLAEAWDDQDQAAEKKQESLSAGPIAIHLDGLFCHAASIVTLLVSMMQKP